MDIPISLWRHVNNELKCRNARLHRLLNKNYFLATLLRGRLDERRILTAGERDVVGLEVQKGVWSADFLDV